MIIIKYKQLLSITSAFVFGLRTFRSSRDQTKRADFFYQSYRTSSCVGQGFLFEQTHESRLYLGKSGERKAYFKFEVITQNYSLLFLLSLKSSFNFNKT